MSSAQSSERSYLQRLSDTANRATELLLLPISIVFVSIIFVSVLTRFVFHHPIVESVELARLSFLWTILLACAIGVHRHAHVAIQNLRTRLPRSWQKPIAIAVHLISGGFGALMFWYGLKLADRVWQTNFPTLGWSQGWLYLPLAISGALIVLHSVSQAVAAIGSDSEEITQS
jgi:TRAP-type transport system small permease protein